MKQKINNRLHYFLTSLLVFFMPIHSDYLPILIVLLTINWLLFFPNVRKSFQAIKKNYALLALVALYLLNVIGLINTVNLKFAGEELETKLSFLILPLIYSSRSEEDENVLYHYLRYFIYGCIAYSIICFGYSFYAYFKPVYTNIEGNLYNFGTNYFYYTYLSLFFHPTYSAIYSAIGIYFIYFLSEKKFISLGKWWIAGMVVLSVFVLLLSSKAGWLSLLVVYLMIGYKLIRQRQFIIPAVVFIFLAGTFMFLNVLNAPESSQRIPKISTIESSLTGKDNENRKVNTGTEGSTRRIFVWKASWAIFKEHFLIGVGTGDSKDALMSKYQELNMRNEFENKLNSHNQFFTFMLAFGIFGLIVFLSCLILPLRIATVQSDYLIFVFVAVIALNCLFESIFERQDGVVFYAFFHSLFCSVYGRKNMAGVHMLK